MIYIQLLEQMALIAVSAYIYNQLHIFKNLIKDEITILDKIGMIIFFSILAIVGTYTGVSLEPYAIANTRAIGSIMAGYVGGPIVGISVGLIAGSHRFLLGGFTALACCISTVCEGIMGALARKYSKERIFSVKAGFVGSILAECIQMINLLIFARPFQDALNLVKYIALPMILVNSIGVVIFINIIQNAKNEYARIGAMQAQKALSIAKRTITHMRKGLNKTTAKNIAEIIYEMSNIKGVFIGDKNLFLSYCGDDISLEELKKEFKSYNEFRVSKIIKLNVNNKKIYFLCVPFLVSKDSFEGVLGLQVKSKENIDSYFLEFAKELSELLSTQIELYKLNKLAAEASTAEFRALRAQIEPHFLFNALNTIASFCRTNPLRAKELIIDLSNYFRQTLKREDDFVLLKDELEFLQSYLSIEKARFGDRLQIEFDIPENMMNIKVPVFILQPIIENSIKHGILPKISGGSVSVTVQQLDGQLKFSISDTGVGMENKKFEEVTTKWPGIGLKNVNDRLKLLYGENHGLNIKTILNVGTRVEFLIPKEGQINGKNTLCNSRR